MQLQGIRRSRPPVRERRRAEAGGSSAHGCVFLVLVGLALTVSCSGRGDGDSAEATVAAAWSKATQDATARLHVTVDASADGASARTVAKGIVDFKAARGAFTVDSSTEATSMQSSDVITEGDAVYVKVSPDVAERAGRQWAQFRPEDRLLTAAVAAIAAVPLQGSANPLRQATTIVKAGREPLGVLTTHYRAMLSPPPSPAPEGRFRTRLGSQVPADVWVDDAGRLRKLEVTAAADGDAVLAGRRVTYQFDDFGVQATDFQIPGATHTIKATTLPLLGPPSAGLTTVLDSHGDFVISYPTTWRRLPDSDGDARLVLDGGRTVRVTVRVSSTNVAIQAGNLAEGKRIIDSLPSISTSPSTTLTDEPIALNEFLGYYRLVVPRDNPSAREFAEAQYYLFHERKLFTLILHVSPGSAFAGLAPTLDKIAESFHAT